MPTKPKAKLAFLDAIRCAATLCILLFHLQPVLTVFFGEWPLVRFFYLGVDVFFALSGFLIFYHYADKLVPFDRATYKDFLLHRLLRLYPVHLFILLLLAALVWVLPRFGMTINNPEDYTLGSFVAQLFLVSAWQFPAQMNWNYFAWAISALWFAYLLAPLFIIVLSKIKRSIDFIICAILLIAVTPLARHIWPYESFVSYALFRVVCGFCLGGLSCRWMMFKKWTFPEFENKPITLIARLSYCLYMGQFVVLMAFKKALPPAHFISWKYAYISAEIAAVFLFALVLHLCVEEPARKWLSPKVR